MTLAAAQAAIADLEVRVGSIETDLPGLQSWAAESANNLTQLFGRMGTVENLSSNNEWRIRQIEQGVDQLPEAIQALILAASDQLRVEIGAVEAQILVGQNLAEQAAQQATAANENYNTVRQDLDDAVLDLRNSVEANFQSDLFNLQGTFNMSLEGTQEDILAQIESMRLLLEAEDDRIVSELELVNLRVSNTGFIRKTDGVNRLGEADIGEWTALTGAAAPESVSMLVPGSTEAMSRAIEVSAPGAKELTYYTGANLNGKTFLVRGWIQVDPGATARIGIVGSLRGATAEGETVLGQTDPIATEGAWEEVDLSFSVAVDTNDWVPAILTTGGRARIWRLGMGEATTDPAIAAQVFANSQAIIDESTARAQALTNLAGTVDELSADVTDILALETSLLTGTAMGTFLTNLSVDAADTQAEVEAQGAAIATMEGIAQAGYMIRAQAGGAVSLIDLVAASDGESPPTSLVRIAADDILLEGSVGANQLVVTDFSGNQVVNGDFARGDLRGWAQPPNGWSVVARDPASPVMPIFTMSSNYALRTDDSPLSNQVLRQEASIAVRAGDRFSISYDYAASGALISLTFGVQVEWFDGAGIELSVSSLPAPTPGGAWQSRAPQAVVAPAGATSARLRYYIMGGGSGRGYFANTRMERQRAGSVLITPNSITGAQLITTQALLTSSAQIGNLIVTNAHIENLTVGTGKIADGATTATAAGNGNIPFNTGWANVAGVGISCLGNRGFLVTISGVISNGSQPTNVRVLRSGGALTQFTVPPGIAISQGELGVVGFQPVSFSYTLMTTSWGGYQDLFLQVQKAQGDNFGNATCGGTVTGLELKK